MSGVISSNLKQKVDVSISNRFPEVHKCGIHKHRHTHTHTHDDSIRRNAMRCISPKNDASVSSSLFQRLFATDGHRPTDDGQTSTLHHNITPFNSVETLQKDTNNLIGLLHYKSHRVYLYVKINNVLQ